MTCRIGREGIVISSGFTWQASQHAIRERLAIGGPGLNRRAVEGAACGDSRQPAEDGAGCRPPADRRRPARARPLRPAMTAAIRSQRAAQDSADVEGHRHAGVAASAGNNSSGTAAERPAGKAHHEQREGEPQDTTRAMRHRASPHQQARYRTAPTNPSAGDRLRAVPVGQHARDDHAEPRGNRDRGEFAPRGTPDGVWPSVCRAVSERKGRREVEAAKQATGRRRCRQASAEMVAGRARGSAPWAASPASPPRGRRASRSAWRRTHQPERDQHRACQKRQPPAPFTELRRR